jgi:signal transduction histidine kinase
VNKHRLAEVFFLILLILAGVLLLSLFWEFYLEDLLVPYIYEYYHPEPVYERWEFVITAVAFSAIALIYPALVAFRNMNDADQAREALSRAYDDLEYRVQDRTRELADTNRELQGAIAKRQLSEDALRRSEKELRLLSAQLLTAQENERRRIALDLHDNVSQTLVAMKFRIEHALDESADKAVDPAGMSAILVPLVQETIEEVRKVYMHLRPSMLDDLGLSAALAWLWRDFRQTNPDIRVHGEVDITDGDIADSLKVVIFRVVQRALDNIAWYSKADQIHVNLTGSDNGIELTVRDNGIGFSPEDALSADDTLRSVGFSEMRGRIELVGGTFSISSGKGEGTTIHASIPVTQHYPA